MIRTGATPKKIKKARAFLEQILATAHITIGGNNPWDIHIHDERFYERILKNVSMGAGESYMDGWWDCKKLDELFYRISTAELYSRFNTKYLFFYYLKHCLFNLQTPHRARKVAEVHYNLDNQLYTSMLGPTMAYTCGYWKGAQHLDEAQEHKYDLICRKLNIQSSDTILDLGCGFGGFAKFAAMTYGCSITAVNISAAQVQFAKESCSHLPITIHHTDYRNIALYNPRHIQFDKIVSIGMCEHVGNKNYHTLMQVVHSQLKNQGLFLLHTIGNNKTLKHVDPWINKYIFPHGFVPSMQQLSNAIENFFIMEDWHNFGPDYDHTLMAWYANFQQAWPELAKHYSERFYRMWVYYLLSCAGMFRARDAQLWQIVLSKGRLPGYQRIL